MKFILLAAVALCAVVVSDSACPAGQEGSTLTVCSSKPKWVSGGGGVLKNFGAAGCTEQVQSDNECIKLSSGTWISGHSNSVSTCKVYYRDDCRGSFLDVTIDGRFKFYKPILSFRCNCHTIEVTTVAPTPAATPEPW